MKSYKFRVYPTNKQQDNLSFTLDHCRYLYNTALQQRRDAYKSTGKSIGYMIQQNELPLLKEEFPEYKNIHSLVLQNVLKRVDLAYQSFFRRIKQRADKVGYPRFQGKDRYDSLTYFQSGFAIKNNKVELSKIGLLKAKFYRQIPKDAKICTCTIKREGDKWYVIFACETVATMPQKKSVSSVIGIDLGLTDFAVLSNGAEIKNPKYLKQSEEKLKALQSKYSQRKGKTIKRKLINLHKKVANQRRDFQHKLSFALVNGFDLIAYEDLKVKNMIEDNKYNLQKSINDAGWAQFIAMIKYKAENAGKYAIAVNPKGTTQKCSGCGTIVPKDITVRLHKCTFCGFEASRDVNAALNIHKLGINLVGNLLSSEASVLG